MKRGDSFLMLAFLILASLSGCGPRVPREELGELVFEVPQVPGADEEYVDPKLGPPPATPDGYPD